MDGRKKLVVLPEGRPRVKINWDVVDHYLEAGSSGAEIAAQMGCSKDTLYDKCLQEHNISFSQYAFERKNRGESNLRAKQYDVAMAGDKTMLIWLGKQRLAQRDTPEINREFDGPLKELLDKLHVVKNEDDFQNADPTIGVCDTVVNSPPSVDSGVQKVTGNEKKPEQII